MLKCGSLNCKLPVNHFCTTCDCWYCHNHVCSVSHPYLTVEYVMEINRKLKVHNAE